MNSLSKLTKTTTKQKKRVGRGYGSGVGGHTTTRGSKGQKSRYTVPLTLDGSKIKKSWLKRLPFLRGKGRALAPRQSTIIFKLSQIEKHFKEGDTVSLKTLSKACKVSLKQMNSSKLKILSTGKIKKVLNFDKKLNLSKKTEDKILSSGGKII